MFTEKILTAFRLFRRIIYFIILVFFYLSSSFIIHLITRDQNKRRIRFSSNARFYTTFICFMYDIKTEVIGSYNRNQPGLVIGNHLGFIDILAMHSLTGALFVTSQEMRNTPLLGLLTEMAGCIYVDRRNRSNILNELKHLISSMNDGFQVTLYPEATSHNGEEVLPFKRTLLTAASLAGKPILPYCFNFKSINNGPFIMKYRDNVCWYGDQTFFPAFIRALCIKEITVEVTFLEPYYPSPDEDRGAVADEMRRRIVEKFRPVQA